MKEEFTTLMHYEMLSDEISLQDMLVMGVFGAINRGLSKEEALKKYDMTEEFYDANVQRVLES